MKNLIHPNIVHYFDFFEDENNFFIIVEYINIGDMRQLLNRGRIDEPTIIRMEQLLMGLCFLSEHKIVHGDLKPENIFLRKVEMLCWETLDTPSS